MPNNNQIPEPMDVITFYNFEIMRLYNIYKERIEGRTLTPSEYIYFMDLLTELYKKENEFLGLSMHDKRGRRYMNCLCSTPEDTFKNNRIGHIDQNAHFLLSSLKDHYFIERPDKREELRKRGYSEEDIKLACIFGHQNPLDTIAPREAAIIDLLFSDEYGKKIMKRNWFGYYKGVTYIYESAEDKKYCKAILDLIREIAIRIHNYRKYILTEEMPASNEEVYDLYERLRENRTEDLEFINAGPVGRTLKRIKHTIDLYIK